MKKRTALIKLQNKTGKKIGKEIFKKLENEKKRK